MKMYKHTCRQGHTELSKAKQQRETNPPTGDDDCLRSSNSVQQRATVHDLSGQRHTHTHTHTEIYAE